MAIDTACSSSLVRRISHVKACETANQIWLGGGVNLILTPELHHYFLAGSVLLSLMVDAKHLMRARTDTCGEKGCGVIILKRLSDALRDGDTSWL